jgi:alanine dehydrogenase
VVVDHGQVDLGVALAEERDGTRDERRDGGGEAGESQPPTPQPGDLTKLLLGLFLVLAAALLQATSHLGEHVGHLHMTLELLRPARFDAQALVEITKGREIGVPTFVIGAVLIPGALAPKLISREMVAGMKEGSVVADVAIDQGGCVETSKPTTHTDPVYVVEGVTHYCVANMPGAVPITSTKALTNATLPYVEEIADLGLRAALAGDPALARGVNVLDGRVTYEAVAEAHDLPFTPLEEVLPLSPV